MSRLRVWALGSVLLTTVILQSAESPTPAPAPEGRPIAIVGGMIRTQTDAGDIVGTIIVTDGKITEIGPGVKPPARALMIDASKCVVAPGLIDAHGVLGLNAAAAREGASNAGLNILDAVDPFADEWRDAARHGVTAVYVQPAGSLGGAGAVLRVGPAASAEALTIRAPAAVEAALGQSAGAAPLAANPFAEALARFGINVPQQPAAPPPGSNSLTRFAQAEQLRNQLEAARRAGENKSSRPDPSRELLAKVLKKELPLRLAVAHEDDIRNALKIATDLGLRVIWERVDRAAAIPDEFAAVRSPLVAGPFVGVRISDTYKKLLLDGRRWMIGTFSDDAKGAAGLRLHAAEAVAAGCPRDKVLQALTADAADLLGVGDKLGRLAIGRPADLVVFAGDPLDPSAPVRLTISQGTVTFNDSKAEVAPAPIAVTPTVPDRLPSRYVVRTNRLLGLSGEFTPGEIYVENGKVVERGPSGIDIPVVDVGDAPVTPGLVAAHVAVESESSPDADSAQLSGCDGIAADDSRLRHYRDAGFLTAVVTPGSKNVIAGMACTLPSYEPGAMPDDAGMKFVLSPEARSRERFPISLAGQVEFIEARLRGEEGDTNFYLPAVVRERLLAERSARLAAVKDGKLAAWLQAHNRPEVRAALRLIQEYKLRGVLLMPQQVDELVDEIRSAGVSVVLAAQKPTDPERFTRGLAALGKANVPLAFGGEPAELRVSAAWLTNAGLPRPAARRALMAQPPTAFGLPANTAKLAAGEPADFVIWDGDPIDLASRAVAVVAEGQRVMPGPDDEPKKRPAAPESPAPQRRGRRR